MKRILLVEDDQIDQLAFKRIFNKYFPNDTCIIASTIQSAIEEYKRNAFDFLVVDFNLADGNAFEFLSHQLDTPSIILSGSIDSQLVEQAKEMGTIDFLLKDTQLQYLPKVMELINHQLNMGSTVPSSYSTQASNHSNKKTFDLQFLNKTFDENKIKIKEVLEVFVKHNAIDLDQLVKGMIAQDSKLIQDKAHKIKSGYRLLGMSLATDLTEKIEEEAKELDENLLPLQKKVDKLVRVSKEAIELIQQLLKSTYFD